jgi:hypothetical protein
LQKAVALSEPLEPYDSHSVVIVEVSVILRKTTVYLSKKILNYFSFFEARTCCVVQSGLELQILLPQPPECWDYKQDLPCPAHIAVHSQSS